MAYPALPVNKQFSSTLKYNSSNLPVVSGMQRVVSVAPWNPASPVAQVKPMPAISPNSEKRRRAAAAAASVPSEILKEAAEKCTDPHWAGILMSASTGKWPRGFRFKNGTVIYHGNKKMHEMPLPNDISADEISNLIINFIRSRTGQQSEIDQNRDANVLKAAVIEEQKIKKNQQHLRVAVANPWRIVNTQAELLSNYIEMMMTEYKIPSSSRIIFFDFIQYGLIMRWITENNMIFGDRKEGDVNYPVVMSTGKKTKRMFYDPYIKSIDVVKITGPDPSEWTILTPKIRRGLPSNKEIEYEIGHIFDSMTGNEEIEITNIESENVIDMASILPLEGAIASNSLLSSNQNVLSASEIVKILKSFQVV